MEIRIRFFLSWVFPRHDRRIRNINLLGRLFSRDIQRKKLLDSDLDGLGPWFSNGTNFRVILFREALDFFDELLCSLCFHGFEHAVPKNTLLDVFYAGFTISIKYWKC